MAGMDSRRRAALLGVLCVALGACGSPEAGRARGGGPGADTRNIGDQIRMHGGSRPYWETPCRGASGAACDEPGRLHAAR
jgi:hypothetical protein